MSKKVVEDGYDELKLRYTDWTLTVDPVHRINYFKMLIERLPTYSRILELGCGPGTPVGKTLASSHSYYGLDFSRAQLAIARQNVPAGMFIRADMTEVEFRHASFDAVAAFYSIIHVPREMHAGLFERIAKWLRPGGLFVASLGARENPGGVDDWIDGVPMYWSGFDAETNMTLIENAGFELMKHEVLMNFEDNEEVMFLWVLGRRRSDLPRGSVQP